MNKRIVGAFFAGLLTAMPLIPAAFADGGNPPVRIARGGHVIYQQLGLAEDDLCIEFDERLGRFDIYLDHCDSHTPLSRTVHEDGSGHNKKGLVFCVEAGECTKDEGYRNSPKWADRKYEKRWGND